MLKIEQNDNFYTVSYKNFNRLVDGYITDKEREIVSGWNEEQLINFLLS